MIKLESYKQLQPRNPQGGTDGGPLGARADAFEDLSNRLGSLPNLKRNLESLDTRTDLKDLGGEYRTQTDKLDGAPIVGGTYSQASDPLDKPTSDLTQDLPRRDEE